MSLPIILEIAVGLIFIYLTLSLVASEIQEILSALFQWRAEHLKRSIEQLLAGDSLADRTPAERPAGQAGDRDVAVAKRRDASTARRNRKAAKTLADKLYDSPLIEDLNYEAQGRLASGLRWILHSIGAIYRTITFSRNVFGNKTSGPSYIPAETFATSLIERLRLEDFQRILTRSRFDNFIHSDVRSPLHNSVQELRARTGDETLLAAEVSYFDDQLSRINEALSQRRIALETAIDQVIEQLQSFEDMAADMPLSDPMAASSFTSRVKYLRAGLAGPSEGARGERRGEGTAVLVARIQPSLSDLTALLDPTSATYNELVALTRREGAALGNTLDSALEAINNSEMIPVRLRNSLATLASRAESKVKADASLIGSELEQLQTELETWFNNGMTRASGVYRRNVKGVGLLIGLAIAFTINADTFYMFQRLSSDPAIRSSIIQAAEQIEVRGIETPEQLAANSGISELSEEIADQLVENMEIELRSVGEAVEQTLAQYPLPIGRSQSVLAAQQAAEANWPIKFIPQRLVGWSITALALSMGASFWFDLLRKVTSVRASGDKPKD